MRRLLALLLPLCLSMFVGGAWGATYQFTDPSAALTAIPTMTASDTMQLGCTLAGPVTLSAGTYDVLPGYTCGVTSASTDANTGSLHIGGSVTVKHCSIKNTTTGFGRAVYCSANNCLVSENYIQTTGAQTGFLLTGINCKVINNRFKTSYVAAISNSARSEISGNVFEGPGYGIGGAVSLTADNNTFYNLSYGIAAGGSYKNNLFYAVSTPVVSIAVSLLTNSAWNGNVSSWGAGCVSFSGSPFYQTPSADNPWTWVPGPWFPGNFAGVPLPTVPEVATAWYDASAGTETAPMTQGVADGVTYIYSTMAFNGYKSVTVNVPEAGTYKISASVSAPDTLHNSWDMRVDAVADVNTGAVLDSFVIKGVGQGFHEEDVTAYAGAQNTRYWNLAAGNVVITWQGRKTNTALASFRLVKVGNPDILGRDRRIPSSTIGAVEYYPRPVPDDPFRWDE